MKGQLTTGTILLWLILGGGIMSLVMVLSVLFWIDGKLTVHADTFPAEASNYAQRVLFSAEGLAAVDSTGRALVGTIDGKKLSQPDIGDVLAQVASGKKMGAKITIDGKEIYVDRAKYASLLPLVRPEGSGAGAAREQTFKITLLVRDATDDRATVAQIHVLGASS